MKMETKQKGTKVKASVLALAVLVLLTSSGPAWPVEGMISYWKFDEGSGTIATDSVGTNDGNLVNGPVWTSGQVDGALSFDGIDDYVEVQSVVQDDFSIEFWVKTTQVGNTSVYGAFTSTGLVDGEVGGFAKDYIVGLHANNIAFGTGYPDTSIYSSSVVNDGIWHYVVATRKKSDALKLYIDSNLEATGSTGVYSLTDPQSLSIGRLNQHQWYFNGLMDELAFYDRVLNASEIQQHYQCGLNGVGYDVNCLDMVEALIDIDPDTLNKKSHGKWITTYITLPDGFDVNDIEVNTVAITSLLGESCDPDYQQPTDPNFTSQVGDRDEDGIPDLTVKFDRQVLLPNLCLDDVGIAVEGDLTTGRHFSGSDTIRIIDRGK
jgi:hypothetical protein